MGATKQESTTYAYLRVGNNHEIGPIFSKGFDHLSFRSDYLQNNSFYFPLDTVQNLLWIPRSYPWM